MGDAPHGALGIWYADPPDPVRLEQLLRRHRSLLERHRRRGGDCRRCRLILAAAHFWQRHGDDSELVHLHGVPGLTRHQRALLHLIHGQLLASRQRSGAHQLLQQGFDLGTPLFHPADYFLVLNRHRSLAPLPLSGPGSAPRPLHELLEIAAVVERLQRASGARPAYQIDRTDTYG